jgi:hypothetical protein
MSDVQIRVEGTSEDLEQLRRELLDGLGSEVRVQPIPSRAPGELREPILIGLVVAIAPIAIESFRKAVERYMEHRETMEELRLYRDGDQGIGVADLTPEEFAQ